MPNLSTSLNNAMAGLNVLARVSETVSSNVANAMTPGYAPRETNISQRIQGSLGLGAAVNGYTRHVDPNLLSERRFAGAELAKTSEQVSFYTKMESKIGLPDDAGSLSGRLAHFGSQMIAAASRPDSEGRLQLVFDAAQSVTQHLNSASDAIQNERLRADTAIGNAVDFINSTLEQIAALNGAALRAGPKGVDGLSIQDQRQRLVDGLSELIPVREVPRDNGTIALFSPGGAILLDGSPAKLGFVQAGTIVPELDVGAGTLSGLTINGRSISTSAEKGPISGGRLAGLFDVRDVQAPAVQTQIDAFARDFIERFESPLVDPTLAFGDPGLFTDSGGIFVLADEIGLAGRISINALVDPSQGGALWRLRDGLGAVTAGSVGNSTLLNTMSDALSAARIPATGGFSVSRSAAGTAGALISNIGNTHSAFATIQSFSQARSETLINAELKNGVDTDGELQRLMLVEQAFAANAKVISTIDELIQTLLRI